MGRPELKLIRRTEPVVARGGKAAALGALLLAAALAATWLGADAARQPIDARERSESALTGALERGNEDRQVRATLVELREALGRRPLDSRTRAVYAGLLLSLARSIEDTRAAAFHAQRAVELAPVTVPVVRSAALVLAHAGETERTLQLVRDMFGYDPPRAAKLLRQVGAVLGEAVIEHGLPETPGAWLAWRQQLREDGRVGDADDRLERAFARWPEDLRVLEEMSARAVARRDFAALGDLLPPERVLPDEPSAAGLLLHRAWLKASRGDPHGAGADIDQALSLTDQDRWMRILAADVYEYLGDVGQARRLWTGALFGLPPDQIYVRREVLVRLARLEDRHGPPGKALRLWESVLELSPDDSEARRRVDDLAGFER